MPPALRVRNMPPFFSGLGVLDPFRFVVAGCGPDVAGGGDKVGPNDGVVCSRGEVFFLMVSAPELARVVYDGLEGRLRRGRGGGLAMS